jgi:hypothetical protein
MPDGMNSLQKAEQRLAEIHSAIALTTPSAEEVDAALADRRAQQNLTDWLRAQYHDAMHGPENRVGAGFIKEPWVAPVSSLDAEFTRCKFEIGAAATEAQRVTVMLAYGRRWAAITNLSDEDRRLLANRAGVADWVTREERSASRVVPRISFEVSHFLSLISARGGTVTAANGKIRVTPRGILNDVDRRNIQQHRAEIIAALSESEEV